MMQTPRPRSPSFPFIALDKAVHRARQLHDAHGREPVAMSSAARTWGFAPHSSAFLQTIAALRQYGLIEKGDAGTGQRVLLTNLGFALAVERRPGDQLQLMREAISRSTLISQFAHTWSGERPPDDHCISQLMIERGFSKKGAVQFLAVLDDTLRQIGRNGDQPVIGVSGEGEEHPGSRRMFGADRIPATERHQSSAGVLSVTFMPAGGVEIIARLNDEPSFDRLLQTLSALRPMVV